MSKLSEQAQVAKRMKQFCKSLGVKCSARSESYSMGDSVNVTVYDQPPTIMAKINEFAAPFQYGHFDGMTDMYEYSNRRDDIPQTKYLFVDNEYSDELRQAAWDFMRNHISDAQEGPENVAQASHHRMGDGWGDQALSSSTRSATMPSPTAAGIPAHGRIRRAALPSTAPKRPANSPPCSTNSLPARCNSRAGTPPEIPSPRDS